MPERTCDQDGCERKHLAKGLCAYHYNAKHREVHGRQTFERTCVVCGTQWETRRADAKFCSDACKGDAYRTHCQLPPDHPVMKGIVSAFQTVKPRKWWRVLTCTVCNDDFTVLHVGEQLYCSTSCKNRTARIVRRGRAYGWTSHYTWMEVIRLFITFDRCCAYCEQPIDGQPEPDHVVPLSRGGADSITNILPSCHMCNADKRNLLLGEWAGDRARRHMPPVTTSWDLDDRRVRHLTVECHAA